MGGETWECTPQLRWVRREVEVESGIGQEQRVLQQTWICQQTGKIQWADVPITYDPTEAL